MSQARAILTSRRRLLHSPNPERRTAEGGCGVIGAVGTAPLPGRCIIRPCQQMRNRGNGKGGGVAASGLFSRWPKHYALHLALLDEQVRGEVEASHITSCFDIAHAETQPCLDDHREAGLEVRPPRVQRYFVRVKPAVVERFIAESGIEDPAAAEDEFVFQNSFRLNQRFYVEGERPRAFVLSHGRDLMILKGVGYAEEVARYYQLEDVRANVWIGHQRYPTRGRVWHPGGAHPFAGLHEALVHNGDFANYHAITEYLRQRNIAPQFVTDTEVSVLLFDLYVRVYGYPLEYVFEALAPTPTGDFERLPKWRQRIYRALQSAHLHGSPDGPWFFIVARADPATGNPQLIGITDVSMLRPQVFAFQEHGGQGYGAIASEKQAIDAFFEELGQQDPDHPAVADQYWNARGGSCTDGGAFTFTVDRKGGGATLRVTDKFGTLLAPRQMERRRGRVLPASVREPEPGTPGAIRLQPASAADPEPLETAEAPGEDRTAVALLRTALQQGDVNGFQAEVVRIAELVGPHGWQTALDALTLLRDLRWDPGEQRRARMLTLIDEAIGRVLDALPGLGAFPPDGPGLRLDRETAWAGDLPLAPRPEAALVVDARGFPPEGPEAVCRVIVAGHRRGWRRFVIYRARGDRFLGTGLGPETGDVRIDVYGSSGDYLASGMDGAHLTVHGDAQDQVGQILKSGRVVIYGDVGQTFLYGAKGGEAFVMGSAAGRPLINAVGHIRAVINGTCLDYCAESFMAGEQLDGGFVIINGLGFDERGTVIGLESKYAGNNLFSLASGGACYLNDPYRTVQPSQLNGAAFVRFRQADWHVMRPYLQLNQTLFGISIRHDLLRVDGVIRWPKEVFRKVVASAETEGLDWTALPA